MCAKALWDILNLGEKHNDVYHLWNIMRTTSLRRFTLINISLHCIPFEDAIYLCKVEYLIVAAIKKQVPWENQYGTGMRVESNNPEAWEVMSSQQAHIPH